MNTIDGSESKRNARSLCLNGVNFQADKKLVRNASAHCKLERAGVARVCRSPYNKEERLQKALDYLEENGCLKVRHYMELTGLAHTTAGGRLHLHVGGHPAHAAALGNHGFTGIQVTDNSW